MQALQGELPGEMLKLMSWAMEETKAAQLQQVTGQMSKAGAVSGGQHP